MGRIASAVALVALAGLGSFLGDPDGKGRRGADDRRDHAVLVPAGDVHDGQPARRAGAAAE